MSSDSRWAQPRPHPSDKATLARGKSGRRRSIALQVFDRRCRAAFVIKLEGRPPCRPTFSRSMGQSISMTRPRWRAGKVGADGAAPSRRDDLCLARPCPPRPSGPLRCASLAPPSASVVSSDLPVVLWNRQCRPHFRDFVAARRRGSLGSVPRVKNSARPANGFVQPS